MEHLGLLPPALLGLSVLTLALLARYERTSGAPMRTRRAEQALANELPYWTFVGEAEGAAPGELGAVAVLVDGSYVAFFEVTGVDTDCLDDETLNQIARQSNRLLATLGGCVFIQVLCDVTSDVEDRLKDHICALGERALGRALAVHKAKHLNQQGLQSSAVTLAVGIRPRSSGDGRRPARLTAAVHSEMMKRLLVVAGQVMGGLEGIGVQPRRLGPEELSKRIFSRLNPGRPVPIQKSVPGTKLWIDARTPREALSLTGIEEEKDHLLMGDTLVRVLTMRDMPTETYPGSIETLLFGLEAPHRLSVGVELVDDAAVERELVRMRDRARMFARQDKRNQRAEAQEEEAAALIDEKIKKGIGFAKLALSVIVSVPKKLGADELDRQTADIVRRASSTGIELVIDEYSQLDEFLATLPGNVCHGNRFSRCTTENVAHLLPLSRADEGSSRPTVLVQNARGNLIGIDPFDPDLGNFNGFVAGASGAGKSMMANDLALSLYSTGAKVFIFDIGGSYRRLTRLVGGQYFDIGNDASAALNPLPSSEEMLLGDDLERGRRLAFLVSIIERMVVSKARPEFRRSERAVVAEAIRLLYRKTALVTPRLSDLVAVFAEGSFADPEDGKVAKELARDLRVFTEGPASRLVNRPSSIDIKHDFVTLDLKGLEHDEDLRGVMMLMLTARIWDMVTESRTRPKIIIFDEVWKLLESESTAQLLAELYRTARKYHCSITTISQSVEDFTRSSLAQVLVDNSSTRYLLRREKDHGDVAKRFGLNDRELRIFRELEMKRGHYSEMLVCRGRHHFLARWVLSPLEYWMATTHSPDLKIEEELRTKLPKASESYLLGELALRFPHGAEAHA